MIHSIRLFWCYLALYTISVQAQCNLVNDQILPARNIGGTDPALAIGGSPFITRTYGYDCYWTVDLVDNTNGKGTNDGSKYITVNGQATPPAIKVWVGSRVRITLINHLPEDVTLHFHGLLQEYGYNVMDGPQGLTQRSVLAELYQSIS